MRGRRRGRRLAACSTSPRATATPRSPPPAAAPRSPPPTTSRSCSKRATAPRRCGRPLARRRGWPTPRTSPSRTARFDGVLSTFGVMFTPNPERAASELARVCRPGGRIGLANWTPEGFIGQMFKIIGAARAAPGGRALAARVGQGRPAPRAVRGQGQGRGAATPLHVPLPLRRRTSSRRSRRSTARWSRRGTRSTTTAGPRCGRSSSRWSKARTAVPGGQ